ncbi:ABC transporter permease [Clostridium sp. 19966]|uniref:ABC transporter permease n=1 Tax=Clostridium sp. 19966 TaxID=2768166 RepID=UPI0028DEA719|nr:ABC transporter permease [Clostridium sp. 19966]MDT8715881.1 ABC transporter permease [Clostridium sp. 19966]
MSRLRTIYAVARKDLSQYFRYPSWFIQLLIWPLFFPIMYILSAYGMSGSNSQGLSTYKSVTGTDNFVGFIVIGTMVYMWANMTMWSFGTYLRDEQNRGTLESNWLCPIHRFDILLGGSVVSIVNGIISIIISLLEYRFILGVHFTGSMLLWILAFIVLMPGVYGLSAVFASLVLWVKETNSLVQLVRGLIMILCGISFPIAVMPQWMQIISKFLPFTFGISASRTLMLNSGSLSEAMPDLLACLLEGIVYLIIGRLCFMAVDRKVRFTGSLDRF